MGNFPLCIPKPDAIVFRDCPTDSTDFVLHHQIQIGNTDEQRPTGPAESGGYSNDPQRVNDATVLGIELDQDSVCA